MSEAIKGAFNRRKSEPTDISPGDTFSPLTDEFKPDSTRARFEELVSTYRNTHDARGKALSGFDKAVGNGGSLFQLMAMAKGGELPPTSQIERVVNRINFNKLREHATTFQGKKVIDNLENSTSKGLTAFQEINGEDNAQEIIGSMNSIRKKTIDERKAMTKKAKESTAKSKTDINAAGKDVLVLAKGIGTSSSSRKALGDMFSLISATIQKKEISDDDSTSLVDRVRNLVIEVRNDTGVRKSMSSLHSLYGTSFVKGTDAMKGAREKTKDHPALEDYKQARRHAEDLFSRIGGGYDITKITTALTAVGVMIRDNQNIRDLMDNTKSFGDWAMNVDEDELTNEQFVSRSKDLIHQSQSVFTEEDGEQFNTLSREFKAYTRAVQENPVLVEYKDSLYGLARSVSGSNLDSEARAEHLRALRQDMMANLPILMQTLRYVPLPRVSGENKDLEFAADNIVLDLKHFVPEHISFDIHSEVYPRSAMLKDKSAMRSRHDHQGEQFYYINITGVNCVAKRVAFYLKKKKGLPRLAEKGIADLVIGERGMDIAIRARRLHPSEKPQRQSAASAGSSEGGAEQLSANLARELDIADVNVKLHHLDMRVHENKHNICSTLGIMLMRPVARKLVARTIAKSLTDQLVAGDKIMSKYSATAHTFVANNTKKAMASAKKGVQKGKEQASSMRTKAKNPNKDAAKKATEASPGTVAKDASKEANTANERHKAEAEMKRSAPTGDKLQQQREERRDSLVEQSEAEPTATQV
ncbi:hypothetical protein IW140_003748 [Coemansia sp. RSA 1813]|nr:hypothetical protein EV178_003538 [Coemansia sp. RSA 1646]KAJ1772777.1 hypothetical protein LPJ74_001116 [Coemansia sp. RSA 1843]KAJ2211063.1 hypothetical protein EV179_005796 [Coemansia sp. RSA 487]KAJ2568542.1 hypothetical protein IW140_003748 [Coemansia sp. RSA 1813]